MTATVRPAPSRPADGRPGRGPGRQRPPAPDPQRLAGLLVRVWLEVRAGRRPLDQLRPLVSPGVHRRLAGQLPPAGAASPPAHVRRVRACLPAPGICEAAVTVVAGGRTTAVAVRLERRAGRWRAVELTAPEAGLDPVATAVRPPGWRPRDAFDEVLAGEARP